MTTPSHDDVAARLRAALAETAELRPVGPPPVLTEGSGRDHRRSRRRPAVRIAWVAAPIAVAAAVTAVVVLPDGPAHRPAVHSSAAGASTTASPGLVPAALLTPGGTVPMKPGQYRYERITSKTMTSATEGFIDVFETWVPQDPTQEWTLRSTYEDLQGRADGEPQVLTARCGAFRPPDRTWPDDQATFTARVCSQISTAVRPTSQYIAELPLDPTALYNRLHDDEVDIVIPTLQLPPDGDESFYVWQSAMRLATDATGLSQPFSAALEKAIAMIPGVTVRHDLTNLAGVRGTTYEPPPSPGVDLGAMTFDADGNYIGGPDTTIAVGAADAPLAVPTDVQD